MLKRILLGALVLASALPVAAQDHPKAEVFGGYSYVRFRAKDSGDIFHSNLNGGIGQVAFNATDHVGVVAEFAGYKMSNLSGTSSGVSFSGPVSGTIFSYLFGPRVSFRAMRTNPFVHVLVGGAHLGNLTSTSTLICGGPTSCTLSTSKNGLAMALGGGLDVKAADHVSIRLGQVEYLLTRLDVGSGSASSQHNFRYSAGIVLH